MKFIEGLEKVAVSLGWLGARTAGGVASRAEKSMSKGGPRLGNVVSGVKALHAVGKAAKGNSLSNRLGDALKSTNSRTHFKDMSEGGRAGYRASIKAIAKILPKKD